jgi:hypothetical protein
MKAEVKGVREEKLTPSEGPPPCVLVMLGALVQGDAWQERKLRHRASKHGDVDIQILTVAGRQWLTPVILAIQEAGIRRVEVQSQPG